MLEFEKYDTWEMDVRFAVKNLPGGKPSIAVEALRESLPILYDGGLDLELDDGTSWDQARELARQLNRLVRRVTYTGEVRPELIDQPGRRALRLRRERRGTR